MRKSATVLKGIYATTLAGILIAGIAGCNVGPKYQRPSYPDRQLIAARMTQQWPATRGIRLATNSGRRSFASRNFRH